MEVGAMAPKKRSGKLLPVTAVILALLLSLTAGCGRAVQTDVSGLRIVATIFPAYDWTREILGDRAGDASLTLLLGSGVDMHSFQPTADDVVRISTCDVFIYVGGESDRWVDDALAEAVNPNMVVVNLMEILGDAAREEELVEGMQADEDEADGEAEYDEHVWLSLKNAMRFCGCIAERLGEADPENRADYAANADAYIRRLEDLDRAYEAAVSAAPVHTLLFGDRFPFRYLTEDYGLQYYAAFAGCSAETEASFETVIFLSGKVDELALPAVLTIETGDGKIARTIVDNTREKSAQVLCLDSLQSTTAQEIEAGATYLGAMEENLEILRRALSA